MRAVGRSIARVDRVIEVAIACVRTIDRDGSSIYFAGERRLSAREAIVRVSAAAPKSVNAVR